MPALFLAKLISFLILVYCSKYHLGGGHGPSTPTLMIHTILISKQRKESVQKLVVSYSLNTINSIRRVSNFAQHTYIIVYKITSTNQGSTVNAVNGGWINECSDQHSLFLRCSLIFWLKFAAKITRNL